MLIINFRVAFSLSTLILLTIPSLIMAEQKTSSDDPSLSESNPNTTFAQLSCSSKTIHNKTINGFKCYSVFQSNMSSSSVRCCPPETDKDSIPLTCSFHSDSNKTLSKIECNSTSDGHGKNESSTLMCKSTNETNVSSCLQLCNSLLDSKNRNGTNCNSSNCYKTCIAECASEPKLNHTLCKEKCNSTLAENFNNGTECNCIAPISPMNGTGCNSTTPLNPTNGTGCNCMTPLNPTNGTGCNSTTPLNPTNGTGCNCMTPLNPTNGTGCNCMTPLNPTNGTGCNSTTPLNPTNGTGCNCMTPLNPTNGTGCNCMTPLNPTNGTGCNSTTPLNPTNGTGCNCMTPLNPTNGTGCNSTTPLNPTNGTGCNCMTPLNPTNGTGCNCMTPLNHTNGTGCYCMTPLNHTNGTGCNCMTPLNHTNGTGCNCMTPLNPTNGTGCNCMTPLNPTNGTGCNCMTPLNPTNGTGCNCMTPLNPTNGTGCNCMTPLNPTNGTGCNCITPVSSKNGTECNCTTTVNSKNGIECKCMTPVESTNGTECNSTTPINSTCFENCNSMLSAVFTTCIKNCSSVSSVKCLLGTDCNSTSSANCSNSIDDCNATLPANCTNWGACNSSFVNETACSEKCYSVVYANISSCTEECKETCNSSTTSSLGITSSSTNEASTTPKSTKNEENVTTQPQLDGKVVDIKSAVHLDATFLPDLQIKSSPTYQKYKTVFQTALGRKFQTLEGFIGVQIIGFRNGSIIADYSIKIDASFFLNNQSNVHLGEQLADINKNWTGFQEDLLKENIPGNLNKTTTGEEIKSFLDKGLQDINICNIKGVCPFDQVCKAATCHLVCTKGFCNSHGTCIIESSRTGKTAKCVCDVFYTGEQCERKSTDIYPVEDRLLIIEIAGGAGGGVVLFLLVILVCVCVKWRKTASQREKSDELSLKENEAMDLKVLGGKTNPIYEKDIESNIAESIPGKTGYTDRGPFSQVPSERILPSFDTSDNSMGHRMERFGEPLDYNRDMSERNTITRDDGRVYHVIDDGDPSNQTLLYQPSRYQQSNGSVTHDHDQPRYSDYPRRHTTYDHIDTSREYKIARPNFGGRSRNYEYVPTDE